MARNPIFLERRGYRVRRMMDAARFLPFLGLALWMVPLLWPGADGTAQVGADPVPLSVALRYIFGIWGLLVLAAWALWRRTGDGAGTADVTAPGSD
ncbi:MAG: hypothetical protein ACSHXB_15575 [Sulfitobacter sp.]